MSRRAYAPSLSTAPDSTKLVKHTLNELDESNEEYESSTFGGFSDYMRRKKIKLQNQDALTRANAPPGVAPVFAGMTIHINGYTKPGRVELWHTIVTYGGVYKQYLEGKTDVTHIIASNLTKKKQEEFARYRVVRPEWIMDSVSAGKALPWTDPKYRVIDAGRNQKVFGVSESGGVALTNNDLSRSYKRVTSINSEVRVTSESDNTNAVDLAVAESPLLLEIQEAEREVNEAQKIVPHPGAELRLPTKPNRLVTKTAKDADFIQDYFRNSRLHHLSTWKANLRLKIDNLARRGNSVVRNEQRYIMHIDFDCFFAAVSSMNRPDVAGMPCAVTHGGNNSGEIASCNYKAREYGIKNGMWMKEAVKLCPAIISLPYDFDGYEVASDKFYQILLALNADALEAVSIDEALVDITNLLPNTTNAQELSTAVESFAAPLRILIRQETGVEVSLGIGANVLQAKLATKKAKPAGHYFLPRDQVLEFMASFDVASIPGVGSSTASKLREQFEVTRISELRDISETRLREVFGPKTGVALAQASLGNDDTVVGEIAQRKLVSIEINWGIRLDTPEEVSDYMRRVSEELCRKLKDVGFVSAQHLLVKVMRRSKMAPVDPPKFLGHGICDKFNAGREIPMSGSPEIVWKHSLALLESLNIPPHELRGIGVALTKLQSISASGNAAQKSINTFLNPVSDIALMTEIGVTTGKTSMGPPAMKHSALHAINSAAPKTNLAKASVPAATQFIIPTQLDQTVLAELPAEIRSRIELAGRNKVVSGNSDTSSAIYDIPSMSQIDPADLAALPASVRHELVLYSKNRMSPKRNRDRNLNEFVVKTPSPKKNKKHAPVYTLTQGKFVDKPVSRNLTSTLHAVMQQTMLSSSPSSEIDREVLAGLPEEIRMEVIHEDRQKRLASKLKEYQRKNMELDKSKAPSEKFRRTLELPEVNRSRQMGDLGNESLESLRKYLSTWFEDSIDEGPEEDDTADFAGYLRLLVAEERDLERVEALLRWLWLVVRTRGMCLNWIEVVRQLIESTNDLLMGLGFGVLQIS